VKCQFGIMRFFATSGEITKHWTLILKWYTFRFVMTAMHEVDP